MEDGASRQKEQRKGNWKNTILQAAVKQFKADIKILKRQCVEEQHGVCLSTSYARNKRLRQLAVKNKHTMLRGAPKIDDDEAETITKAILAMKGIHQMKYRMAWQEGTLKLSPKPMSYKGNTLAWTRSYQSRRL